MSLLDFLRQPSTTDVRGFLRDIPVRKGGILPLTEYGDGSARLDWTAGVPGSIMEAFTAPARAYRGEIAPEQMIPEGLNFAGSVALGSAGVTRPKLGASVPRDEAIAQAIMREHPVQGKWDQTVGTSDYFMPQTLPNPGRVPQGNRPIPTVLDRENGWGDVYMQSGSTNPDHAARATASLEHFGVPGMKTPMNDLAAEPLTTYDLAALNQAWRNKVRHTGKFFSNPETSAAPGLGLMAAAKQAEQPKGFTAYHGSPHDFDKFDMSKIGTGEGAQAYGHGLYFADSEGVARSYRDSLSHDGLGVVARGRLRQFGGDIDKTIEYLRGRVTGGSDAAAVNGRQALKELELAKAEEKTPGKLYQVRINADPEHFLDWDKPLSQQSEAVRKAYETALTSRGGPTIDKIGSSSFGSSGEAMQNLLSAWSKHDATSVSQSMRDAGIPGIKYLDQGSRAAGDGSRNYVVFDDKIIDILKKYGLLGAMGGGAAIASGSGDANARGILP